MFEASYTDDWKDLDRREYKPSSYDFMEHTGLKTSNSKAKFLVSISPTHYVTVKLFDYATEYVRRFADEHYQASVIVDAETWFQPAGTMRGVIAPTNIAH